MDPQTHRQGRLQYTAQRTWQCPNPVKLLLLCWRLNINKVIIITLCFDEFWIWNVHQPNESVYWETNISSYIYHHSGYPSTLLTHSSASYYCQFCTAIWGLTQPMDKNYVSSQHGKEGRKHRHYAVAVSYNQRHFATLVSGIWLTRLTSANDTTNLGFPNLGTLLKPGV